MGNTVVLEAGVDGHAARRYYLMQLLEEAGLPPGVINFVPGAGLDDRRRGARPAPSSPASTSPARRRCSSGMWKHRRRRTSRATASYPRLVGETGGKDFIVAHPSADPDAVATAIVRGAFEYQGQKCSAASRVYVAVERCGRAMRERLVARIVDQIKVGDVADFRNFMGAVIDEQRRSRRSVDAIELAAQPSAEVVVGGDARRRRGLVRRADGGRDHRPGLRPDAARSSSVRWSRRTCTTRSGSTTRSSSSTAHRPTR